MDCHFLSDEFVPRHAKHCLTYYITKLMKHCRSSSKGEMRQCITSIRCYISNIVDKLPFHMDIISQSTLFMDHRVCYTSLQWRYNEPDGVSNHQPHDSLLNLLFRCRSNKTSKLHVAGLCAENSLVTGDFIAQRANNAENVSIWWRHYVIYGLLKGTDQVDTISVDYYPIANLRVYAI